VPDSLLTISGVVADALDLSGTEISNILKETPLLNRMQFVEASNGITHKYIVHATNPTVGFIAEDGGREFSRSTDTTITATLTPLDFSYQVRKTVADGSRFGRERLIAREGLRHLQAAMVALERQMLNTTSNAGFTGLRTLATLDALSDAMVVNATGSTANTASSVYLINEGDTVGVAGVYRGDGPAVEFGDTILMDFLDGSGLHFPAYYTPGMAWFGLQVGGAYSVSRIANVTADSGKGLTDALLYEAYSRHPAGQKPTVIVMNRRSREQLRRSRTATNATGAPAPLVEEWQGIPIIETDSITSTEALTT
jgi:hypothetical protein